VIFPFGDMHAKTKNGVLDEPGAKRQKGNLPLRSKQDFQ
jgi:hypothetical protein